MPCTIMRRLDVIEDKLDVIIGILRSRSGGIGKDILANVIGNIITKQGI